MIGDEELEATEEVELDETAPAAPAKKSGKPAKKPSKGKKVSPVKLQKGEGGAVLAAITSTQKDGSIKTWAVAMAPGDLEEARRRVEEWVKSSNARVAAWTALGGQAQPGATSDSPNPEIMAPAFMRPAAYDPDAPMEPAFMKEKPSPFESAPGWKDPVRSQDRPGTQADAEARQKVLAQRLGAPAKPTIAKKMSIAQKVTILNRIISDPSYKPTEIELDQISTGLAKDGMKESARAIQDRKLLLYPDSKRLVINLAPPKAQPKPKPKKEFQDPFEKVKVAQTPHHRFTFAEIAQISRRIFGKDAAKKTAMQGRWLDQKAPGWSVMGFSVKNNVGETRRAVTHCIQLPSGKIVPTKIFHCPQSEAVAGALEGGPHYVTGAEARAVFGHHVKSELMGKLLHKVAATCGIGSAEFKAVADELEVPGDWADDKADLHRAKFVDDALHEEQIALFADARRHGMDMYLRDQVFGQIGSTVPGVMRAEIIDPSEVVDRSYDADLSDRLFKRSEAPPKIREVETYDYEGPGPLNPVAGEIVSRGPRSPEEKALAREEKIGWQIPTELVGAVKKKRVVKKGHKIASAVRSYVPARDGLKKQMVDHLWKTLVYRHAMNAAWKRGSKNPTRNEIVNASLWSKKMLMRHGLPTTLSGDSIYGCAVVTPSVLGLDLYDLNPMSWFRSKEVNALYRAQIAAADRKKRAEKLAPLTEETKRRWDEVNAIEKKLQEDVAAIETAKKAQVKTTLAGGRKPEPYLLVGAWWNSPSWFTARRAAVLKEADLVAPDPSRLPPLPVTAEPMPPEAQAALMPGPEPQLPTEAEDVQESAEAENDPEAEMVDGLLGWPSVDEAENAMQTLLGEMPPGSDVVSLPAQDPCPAGYTELRVERGQRICFKPPAYQYEEPSQYEAYPDYPSYSYDQPYAQQTYMAPPGSPMLVAPTPPTMQRMAIPVAQQVPQTVRQGIHHHRRMVRRALRKFSAANALTLPERRIIRKLRKTGRLERALAKYGLPMPANR